MPIVGDGDNYFCNDPLVVYWFTISDQIGFSDVVTVHLWCTLKEDLVLKTFLEHTGDVEYSGGLFKYDQQ